MADLMSKEEYQSSLNARSRNFKTGYLDKSYKLIFKPLKVVYRCATKLSKHPTSGQMKGLFWKNYS